MRRTIVTALAIASICIGIAAARPQGLGLGLMGGDPSGLSLKVWTGSSIALDAGLGYSVWYGSAVQVHGDVLWHSKSLTQSADGYLPLYVGLGARVKLADNSHDYTRIGIRVPFGLEYVFTAVPIGLFLELVPTFDLAPSTSRNFGTNSSVGFRYYFNGASTD